MTEYVLQQGNFLYWSLSGTENIYVLTSLRSRDAQENPKGQLGLEKRRLGGLIPPSVTLTWTEINRAT